MRRRIFRGSLRVDFWGGLGMVLLGERGYVEGLVDVSRFWNVFMREC